MSGFVFAETPGMYGAAALHESIAMETGTAGGAQAGAAGAVVPPTLNADVGVRNAAKIAAFCAHAASMMGMAAGFHGLYGASVASAGIAYDLGDVATAATFGVVDA